MAIGGQFVPLAASEPELFDSLDLIRRRARQWRDDDYQQRLYTLQLSAAGMDPLLATESQAISSHKADPDLADYPYIEPADLVDGVQNQIFQDNRIVASSIAFNSTPEFNFITDHPLIKEVSQAHITDLWDEGDWASILFETAMDNTTLGVGFPEIVVENHMATIERRSPLDVMWDRMHRTPEKWRAYFTRDRMDLDEAVERFRGAVHPDDIAKCAVDSNFSLFTSGYKNTRESIKIVRVWRYWSERSHALFLGSIQKSGTSMALALNEELQYEVTTETSGPNPFGILMLVPWLETMVPGQLRPVSKTEYMRPIVRAIEKIDRMNDSVLERELPFTVLSSIGIDPETIDEIKNMKGFKDAHRVIVADLEDVSKHITRVPAGDMPVQWARQRQELKRELNTASGVHDAERGQESRGEQTAFETRKFYDAAGQQARHTRKQYMNMLRALVTKVRIVEAQYGTRPRTIQLQSGPLDTRFFPLRPFLKMPLKVGVVESSINFTSEEERRQRRMLEFQTIDLEGIKAGVCDPRKVFYSVYRDMGIKDPFSRMMTVGEAAAYEQKMLMEQMMLAEAQAAGQPAMGAGNADNSQPDPAGGKA